MKLYHAPNTRSVKILWLLEELGLAYELDKRELDRGGGFHSQTVPGGKFPAFEDGPVVMNESGAIIEYILDRYDDGRFGPNRTSPEWSGFLSWLHYAESTAFPVFQNVAFHTFLLPEAQRAPVVVETETPWAHDILNHINTALLGRQFLLGDQFSAADIQLGFATFMAKRLRLTEQYAHVTAWLSRLEQRPALQRAVA